MSVGGGEGLIFPERRVKRGGGIVVERSVGRETFIREPLRLIDGDVVTCPEAYFVSQDIFPGISGSRISPARSGWRNSICLVSVLIKIGEFWLVRAPGLQFSR